MHRICFAFGLCGLLFAFPRLDGQQTEKDAGNRQAGQSGGDPARPKTVAGAGKASGADAPARPREAASQQRTGGRSRQHRRE